MIQSNFKNSGLSFGKIGLKMGARALVIQLLALGMNSSVHGMEERLPEAGRYARVTLPLGHDTGAWNADRADWLTDDAGHVASRKATIVWNGPGRAPTLSIEPRPIDHGPLRWMSFRQTPPFQGPIVSNATDTRNM